MYSHYCQWLLFVLENVIIFLKIHYLSFYDENDAVVEETYEEIEDSYDEELEEVKVTPTVKKKKKNPKKDNKVINNNEFAKQKKEMYKNKDKLISNINTDRYGLHKQKLLGIFNNSFKVLGRGILRTEGLRAAALNVPY